ncbi:MAG: methyltransferase domain-containing protein [Candidatus Shapirobacteria bacterium]|jgi:SAM-dependent methyltransferase
METRKAKQARSQEGFFEKYCKGHGIDIGCGNDKITDEADGWDNNPEFGYNSGDAMHVQGVEDEKYDYVNASHILEHLEDPWCALQNWSRILKHGGYMIVMVPHRDLYEKKAQPPSKWNVEHLWFFTNEKEHDEKALSLEKLLTEALEHVGEFEIEFIRVRDSGHTITDPNIHSNGEISIEAVLRKK